MNNLNIRREQIIKKQQKKIDPTWTIRTFTMYCPNGEHDWKKKKHTSDMLMRGTDRNEICPEHDPYPKNKWNGEMVDRYGWGRVNIGEKIREMEVDDIKKDIETIENIIGHGEGFTMWNRCRINALQEELKIREKYENN